MKPRVLVLGASGFIGRRIIHAISETGRFFPVAISRSASRTLAASGVETHDIDVARPELLLPLTSEAAAVVNCVAGSSATILAGARALIDVVGRLGKPLRIVHLSSLAAYGSASGLLDETMPLRGDLDDYSAAKARSDEWLTRRDDVVTLRPGIVFGPGSVWWSDRIARLLVARRLGNLGPRGQGICNLIYVDDVATAVVHALEVENDRLGAYNLASPVPVTWNAYFECYAAALRAVPVRAISGLRLGVETRLLSPPLKVLETLLKRPALARWNPWPPLRPWLPEICGRTARLDVTRAEKGLGMRWTPLEAALRVTADWYLAGGRTAL